MDRRCPLTDRLHSRNGMRRPIQEEQAAEEVNSARGSLASRGEKRGTLIREFGTLSVLEKHIRRNMETYEHVPGVYRTLRDLRLPADPNVPVKATVL